jgi:Flp pilus assembly pilin Flp
VNHAKQRKPNAIKRFLREQHGIAVTEYAICLALIVLLCIGAVLALGQSISNLIPDFAGDF